MYSSENFRMHKIVTKLSFLQEQAARKRHKNVPAIVRKEEKIFPSVMCAHVKFNLQTGEEKEQEKFSQNTF